MAKKDLGFTGAVEKVVEEKVTKMQATGQLPPPEEDQDGFASPPSSPETKRMLAAFPSEKGFYAKIYKVAGNGKLELMDYEIQAPETIEDLELEVNRIVKEKQWGPGNYRVQVRNRHERGLHLNELIIIGGAKPNKDNGGQNVVDPVENLNRTIDIVDKIRGASNPESFGATILKAVEVGRATATSSGNGQDAAMKTIIELAIPLIKDLIARPQAPPVDVDTIVEKVVTRLQSAQPKESFLDSLIKYEEVAKRINPPSKREDALDSVKKVTDIVQAIRPLTGGGAGEPPSWGQLLLEHGSKLLEPIISTAKDFFEVRKMEMQLRMDQIRGGINPQIDQPHTPNLPAKVIHPFASRVLKAINENDEQYFDMFRQQIVLRYGQHVIDNLVGGEIGAELVLDSLQTELGLPSNLPNAKPYVNLFIGYLRGNGGSVSQEKGKILAECKLCKEQYDFESMDAWEKDSKKCDDCQGDLILIKQEGEA